MGQLGYYIDMGCRFTSRLFLLTMTGALLFSVTLSGAPVTAAPLAQRLLSVSAPTAREVHAVGSWYDLHIPAKFRTRQALTVSLLPDPDMNIYLGSVGGDATGNSADQPDQDDGDIDGVFENVPPCITLRLPPDGILNDLTFAHEYGHYVWFDLLSERDRERYRALYDRQRAAHSLVTDYAADSVEEGFAEAFSYFVGRPMTLAHRDPLSYEFLARWPAQ